MNASDMLVQQSLLDVYVVNSTTGANATNIVVQQMHSLHVPPPVLTLQSCNEPCLSSH